MHMNRYYCQTCGQIMFGSNHPNNGQIKCGKCNSIDWSELPKDDTCGNCPKSNSICTQSDCSDQAAINTELDYVISDRLNMTIDEIDAIPLTCIRLLRELVKSFQLNNSKELIEAVKDLLNQLEGIGIYIPGEDHGQWAECEGLSFNRIEKAISNQ